jgi:hypothetical protein
VPHPVMVSRVWRQHGAPVLRQRRTVYCRVGHYETHDQICFAVRFA